MKYLLVVHRPIQRAVNENSDRDARRVFKVDSSLSILDRCCNGFQYEPYENVSFCYSQIYV